LLLFVVFVDAGHGPRHSTACRYGQSLLQGNCHEVS
jgi:hypothetical protein